MKETAEYSGFCFSHIFRVHYIVLDLWHIYNGVVWPLRRIYIQGISLPLINTANFVY